MRPCVKGRDRGDVRNCSIISRESARRRSARCRNPRPRRRHRCQRRKSRNGCASSTASKYRRNTRNFLIRRRRTNRVDSLVWRCRSSRCAPRSFAGEVVMPLTLTCPSCGQQCAVKEEYAGQQVRCPRCPGVITVPLPAPAVIEAEPVAAVPVAAAPGAAPPPIPAAPAGPGFIDNITKLLAANGITGINQILLLVGLGCLALFLITVLLPWIPGVSNDFVRIPSQ